MINLEKLNRAAIKDKAVALLQALIQLDTSNPPGNELVAAQFIARELARAGIKPLVLKSDKKRGNVIARLPATPEPGTKQPGALLLYGHLDVVPAEPAHWKYPPFSGIIAEGCIWGRGAVDMKHTVATQLAIILAIKQAGLPLRREIVFAATADEEENGKKGIRWLLQNYPEVLTAEYALSEVGGFAIPLENKLFYLCETGEKGLAWLKLKLAGTPGHGSLPTPDSAIIKLCESLLRLKNNVSPIYLSNTIRAMLTKLVKCNSSWEELLNAGRIEDVIGAFPSEPAQWLNAQLKNTISITGLKAGYKNNVVPGQAEAILDCRYSVGQTVDDIILEIRQIVGEQLKVEIEVLDSASPTESPIDTPLFQAIAKVVKQYDQEAELVPMLFNGSTDGSFLRQRGVICYGFHPLPYSPEFNLLRLMHSHNERIPLVAFRDGVDMFLDIVLNFCC